MKSSAKILLIASAPIALMQLPYSYNTKITNILLIIYGIIAILDFVFMLKRETNKKLLWIHIVPLGLIVGAYLYFSIFEMGWNIAFGEILYNFYILAALLLSFCALLVHIDHSIKEQRIKELETELKQLKG